MLKKAEPDSNRFGDGLNLNEAAIIEIRQHIKAPSPELLVPSGFLSHLDEIDRQDLPDDLQYLLEGEEKGHSRKDWMLKISGDHCKHRMALFMKLMILMGEIADKEEHFFLDPTEHVKWCAMNALKVVRQIDSKVKKDIAKD